MIMLRTSARGKVFSGFFVSSESLTMLSNPMYAKKTSAAPLKMLWIFSNEGK